MQTFVHHKYDAKSNYTHKKTKCSRMSWVAYLHILYVYSRKSRN